MEDWRSRLLEALAKDGRSDRAISLAVGRNGNFVNQLRNNKKTPSVENALALARELNLSAGYVFSGVNLDALDEEILRAFLALKDPEDRATILRLAQKLAGQEQR